MGLHDLLSRSCNEEMLIDTPIQMVDGMKELALVVSSNKPPRGIYETFELKLLGVGYTLDSLVP